MPTVHSVIPGLSQEEAEKRLVEFGENSFEKGRRYSVVSLILSQFKSPLIYILLLAMAVTLLLNDVVDTVVIGLAVMVNTLLGFWQEYKAERNLEKLAEVLTPKAVVIRDEERYEVAASTLVPGDVVLLEAGEQVPADGVMLRARELMVNEAILTGESVPVMKKRISVGSTKKLNDYVNRLGEVRRLFVKIDDRKKEELSSVYMGTTLSTGSGVMVVAYVGGETQVGEIADQLATTKAGQTPLQKKLNKFSNRLAVMVLFLALLIFVVGMIAGRSFLEIFTLAVAVAVSAIPEGLVVSLTAILAIGMQRILKRDALVRKLVAAEVLGSVSVICSDKTGTLTEGKMKVVETDFVDERLGMCASFVSADLKDPMEVALWEYAAKNLGEQKSEEVSKIYARLDRRPFSSEARYSATLTTKELFIVGAPEVLLGRCRLSQRERNNWEKKVEKYAHKGYRVIASAHRKRGNEKEITKRLMDKPWYFLGLIVYADPVRKGLKKQLAATKQAGVRLKVITGDYRETALQVMKQLGIRIEEEEVMDGSELEQISELEFDQKIEGVRLFARTSPSHKLKIVEALQRKGEVVAMTGDGVNDAPALKKADIGIVVSTASDVSKETADMVLLNDDFSTIVAAVEEGRGIFANLRKVLLYLLSDSFTEVFIILGAILVSVVTGSELVLPIIAVQILWVNLANDGLPNLALTMEPKEEGLLKKKPRSPRESIIDREIGVLIGLISLATGIFVLVAFYWQLYMGADVATARTVAFTLLGIDSLLYVFSCRSLSIPIWRDNIFKNPYLIGAVIVGFVIQLLALYVPVFQKLLKTVPLGVSEWVMILVMSLMVMVIIELTKVIFLRKTDWLGER